MKPKKTIAGIAGATALIMGGVDVAVLDEKPADRVEIVANERVEVTQNGNVVETVLPWKKQSGLKVKYDMGEPTASEKLKDKRNKEVVTELVDFGDGGFKVDILLGKNPATSTFCYQIEGHENYNFFYQPALTQEEIDRGDLQAENMIGSYAVYHKSLRDNEYKTGKVLHIPRPEVWEVDNQASTTIWADLSYSNGSLCVSVDDEFLQKAKYPVRVDPTFGYTSAGSLQQNFCVSATSMNRLGSAANLSVNGTLDSLHMYANSDGGSPTLTTTMFINREDGSGADSHTEVGSTEQDITYPDAGAWRTFTMADEVISADDYVLSAVCDVNDIGSGRVYLNRDTTAANNFYSEDFVSNYAAAKEDPWTETDTSTTQTFSLYATYTEEVDTTCLDGEYEFESFEAEGDADKTFANNWVNGTGDDCEWQGETTTTVSSGTGPSSGSYNGNVFIYTESSSGAANCETTGDVAYLDYDGTLPNTDGELNFFYSMYGAAMGTLSVEGYDGSWTELWSLSGDQGDNWTGTTTLALPATTTDLRFKGVRGTSFTSDMALDSVQLCGTYSAPPKSPGAGILFFD